MGTPLAPGTNMSGNRSVNQRLVTNRRKILFAALIGTLPRNVVWFIQLTLVSYLGGYAMASMKMRARELTAVAVLLVSVSVPGFGQSKQITSQAGQPPIAIPPKEVASNRVGRQPILRVQLDARMAAELAM